MDLNVAPFEDLTKVHEDTAEAVAIETAFPVKAKKKMVSRFDDTA